MTLSIKMMKNSLGIIKIVNDFFIFCLELFDVEKNEKYKYTENENYRFIWWDLIGSM